MSWGGALVFVLVFWTLLALLVGIIIGKSIALRDRDHDS
jgi:hypothetical protein